MQYVRKPEVFEAERYSRVGLQAEKVAKWCDGEQTDNGLLVDTQDGQKLAEYGSYVLKHADGSFSVMGRKEFERDFEELL